MQAFMKRDGVIDATEDLQALKNTRNPGVVMVARRNPAAPSRIEIPPAVYSDIFWVVVVALETIEVEHDAQGTNEVFSQLRFVSKHLHRLGV